MVASPMPIDIIEKETVKTMLAAGQVVIAAGGGGIPVRREGHHLAGAGAVIDKDFSAAVLAEMIDADTLIILTAVEKVAVCFGKPNQKLLDRMTISQARQYMKDGHFAPGSMLPKIEAAIQFVEGKPGKTSLITLLEKAEQGVQGKTGTVIVTD
jgi:carbamate kinase